MASLPAMAIQRANPGLYEMLTNGVLQGGVAFDKAQLNCQNLSKRMMDMADSGGWSQAAAMEEAKSLINNGDADAVRSMKATEKVTGQSGQTWIGGQKRGGAGQPAIKPTHDLAAAGYNMMNALPVTSTSSVSGSSCTGGACAKYASSEEAAAAVVKVLGIPPCAPVKMRRNAPVVKVVSSQAVPWPAPALPRCWKRRRRRITSSWPNWSTAQRNPPRPTLPNSKRAAWR